MTHCIHCGKDRDIYAKGLCLYCYQTQPKYLKRARDLQKIYQKAFGILRENHKQEYKQIVEELKVLR